MSLKKLKDYENNDIQVESAIKDAKGQTIHSTYQEKLTTTSVSDGTINKVIGFDTNGDIVKGTPSGGGMTNPMTTQGDIIIGGSSGAATRLGIGTNGQVLTSNGTTASWQTPSGGSGGTQLYDHYIEMTGVQVDNTMQPIGSPTTVTLHTVDSHSIQYTLSDIFNPFGTSQVMHNSLKIDFTPHKTYGTYYDYNWFRVFELWDYYDNSTDTYICIVEGFDTSNISVAYRAYVITAFDSDTVTAL